MPAMVGARKHHLSYDNTRRLHVSDEARITLHDVSSCKCGAELACTRIAWADNKADAGRAPAMIMTIAA